MSIFLWDWSFEVAGIQASRNLYQVSILSKYQNEINKNLNSLWLYSGVYVCVALVYDALYRVH